MSSAGPIIDAERRDTLRPKMLLNERPLGVVMADDDFIRALDGETVHASHHLAGRQPRDLLQLGMERLFEDLPHIELESVSSTGTDAIDAAVQFTPDVILMETTVRDVDAFTAVQQITERVPGTKVVMLSSVMDFDVMCDAGKAGAISYLSKTSISEDLGAMIRIIHRGETILSMPPGLQRFPLPAEQDDSYEIRLLQNLSARDKSILCQLVSGRTNAQIALCLHVSEATVKAQITKIIAKLNVSGRVQLAVLAHRAGIGTPQPVHNLTLI